MDLTTRTEPPPPAEPVPIRSKKRRTAATDPRHYLSVMNSFIPRGTDHAIREVVLGVGFSRPLPPQVLEIFRKPAGGRLQEDFPRLEAYESRLVNVHIDPHAGLQSANEEPGTLEKVELKQFSKAGLLDWQVGIEKSRIYVACYAYSRWKSVADLATLYLSEVFQRIQPDVSVANSVVCHVVDEFFSLQDAGEGIEELIRPEAEAVSRQALRSDGLFHSNSGWFEEVSESNSRLVRIDLGALPLDQFSGVPDTAKYGIRIETFQRTDAHGHGFPLSVEDASPVRAAFEQMHVRNKELVIDLLQPAARRRIGLEP